MAWWRRRKAEVAVEVEPLELQILHRYMRVAATRESGSNVDDD